MKLIRNIVLCIILTFTVASCTVLLVPENGHHRGWFHHRNPHNPNYQKPHEPKVKHHQEPPKQQQNNGGGHHENKPKKGKGHSK